MDVVQLDAVRDHGQFAVDQAGGHQCPVLAGQLGVEGGDGSSPACGRGGDARSMLSSSGLTILARIARRGRAGGDRRCSVGTASPGSGSAPAPTRNRRPSSC